MKNNLGAPWTNPEEEDRAPLHGEEKTMTREEVKEVLRKMRSRRSTPEEPRVGSGGEITWRAG